jgi:hypothetical protein
MPKRVLLIGIDHYDHGKVPSLSACVNDAQEMSEALERNDDESLNYECRVFTSPGSVSITRKFLRTKWAELFDNFTGDILFYFSGHGSPTSVGGYLVTQDGEPGDPGLAMNDLLFLANRSKAGSILLILDCCFSGDLGNPPNLQAAGSIENQAQLREGLTILAASRSTQTALALDGRSVFTNLVIGALYGGAADVRGLVSAASIYAYAEQALGSWDQRPVYKSHADRLPPVRRCRPWVPDSLLRELPKIFPKADSIFLMAPSFEHTDPNANPDNVRIFEKFKILRNARLLVTHNDKDLYYAALASEGVYLTRLGQFHWDLAARGRI